MTEKKEIATQSGVFPYTTPYGNAYDQARVVANIDLEKGHLEAELQIWEDDRWEPYQLLTKDMEDERLTALTAFIDLRSVDRVTVRWLVSNGIAKDTGNIRCSHDIRYPIYDFSSLVAGTAKSASPSARARACRAA